MAALAFPGPTLRLAACSALCCLATQLASAQVPLPHSYPVPQPVQAATLPPPPPPVTYPPDEFITIPGPLRSLERMAGLSQKASPGEVLPLLARHIYQDGYQGPRKTEFLILIERYLVQAQELQTLAGRTQTLTVSHCDDAAPLLRILGYRLVHGCGSKDASLQTSDPERAFLAVDSGFPITDLEEALQKNVPFRLSYAPTRLPILFQIKDWARLGQEHRVPFSSFIGLLLNDESIARLYWALSRSDNETRHFLQHNIGLNRLLPIASVLDFYATELSVRSGRVLVPGGPAAEPGWTSLVGASPASPANFAMRLFTRDDGWLAAYFDVLSRVDRTQQQHLTTAARLRPYYEAFRPTDKKPVAGESSYRKAAEFLVLATRLTWDASGEPQVPGSLATWKNILEERSNTRRVRGFVRQGRSLDSPDQLIEALAAASQEETESGPLQLYLALCELDRRRGPAHPLSPETVSFLASKFDSFHAWLPTFAEFPSLTDESIVRFLNIAEGLEQVHGEALRANAIGSFQANIGLWQILARQHEFTQADLNISWHETIEPFAKVSSPIQLFDSSRQSLRQILAAAGADPTGSPDQILDLLAGPPQSNPEAQLIRARLRTRIESVLEDQRLVSLDTLYKLSDGLQSLTPGSKGSDDLLSLAGELRGFELPRPIFTKSEKLAFAPTIYMTRHTELQVQTDLTKVIKGPSTKAQLEAARGQLAAFLRDTLVGLNYAYYEPPGAQILHINPLFVRAHDFLGVTVVGIGPIWQAPRIIGAGVSAGGGAYLIGSLADLPYVLAIAEQDFIVPENVQSLVWREVVPDLLTAATLPRWWDVSSAELHSAALYQRSGEELLRASVTDEKLRATTLAILSTHLPPHRLEALQDALSSQDALNALLPHLMPTTTFYLAQQYRIQQPGQAASAGPASGEVASLQVPSPPEAEQQRLSTVFGVPHTVLARSNAPEILNVSPFPASSGTTNRILGESLESTNLYWARLSDELGYSPSMLHLLIPELTRVMIGKIAASDMEDWPAVLRAMQETGDDLRQGRIPAIPLPATATATTAASVDVSRKEIQ